MLSLQEHDIYGDFPQYFKTILLFILIIQVYWSCCSTYREIVNNYAFSRQIANYVKGNNLTRFKILSPWAEKIRLVNAKGDELPLYFLTKTAYNLSGFEIKRKINTRHQWVAVLTNPYFGKNIFYNFNIDNPDILYNTHIPQTPEEAEKNLERWCKLGKPDIIIGKAQVWKICKNYFPNLISIKTFKSGYIWKDVYSINEIDIYVDANRLEELNIVKKDKEQ